VLDRCATGVGREGGGWIKAGAQATSVAPTLVHRGDTWQEICDSHPVYEAAVECPRPRRIETHVRDVLPAHQHIPVDRPSGVGSYSERGEARWTWRVPRRAMPDSATDVSRGRPATPEDGSGTALCAASSESGHPTGRVITVDGGTVLV
jgi:NAD(P)-dependent dehydrogenase (short-subunit alcohol dehydrogenase family)